MKGLRYWLFLVCLLEEGCACAPRADRVVGAYSLDVSKLCSQANLINWRLHPDGTVIEEGTAPGVILEDGSTHTWAREGRWKIVGSLVQVSFDDSATATFRLGRFRGRSALIQVSSDTDSKGSMEVSYVRWSSE